MNKKNFIFSIIVILITILSISLVNATIPVNGIAYYDFSEGSGTILDDVWNSNDGTIDGATWNSNVPNYATSGSPFYSLSFDGTDDYVSIPDNNDFDSISIAGTSCNWVYWTDNTQTGTIISKWYSGSGYGAWSFAIRGDNQKLQFETSGTGSDTILSINSIPQNEWTFVCFTFDSALSNNEGKIYINGILDNQKSMSGTIHTNNAEVRIGKKTHTGDYEFFKGQISNVQIFNTALTEEQIQNLYNYGQITKPIISTPHNEELYWSRQNSTVRLFGTNVNATIIANKLMINNTTDKTYDTGTIQMYSPNTATITCDMLFNDIVVASNTRTNIGGTYGSMNLISNNHSVIIGQNNMEIRCRKTSGAWIDVIYTMGSGHFLKNETFYSYKESINNGITINDESIYNQNITIPYDGFIVIDWNNEIINNAGQSQEVITQISTNKGDCSSFKRDIQSNKIASTGGSCSFNVSEGDNFIMDMYATGTNIDIDSKIHLKILNQANSTILSNSIITTTPTKISELSINNINNLDLIYMKAGLPINDNGHKVNFYFKKGSETTQIIPKTASSNTEVLIMQDIIQANSGDNTIELWAYTETGVANLEKGDFQIYPVNEFPMNRSSFIITANNIFNNNKINNFTVKYNNITEITNNGEAEIFTINKELINVTITSDGYYDYQILNHNTSLDYNANLTRWVYATFKNAWNNSLIQNFNVSIYNTVSINSVNINNADLMFDNNYDTKATIQSCGVGDIYANYTITPNSNINVGSYRPGVEEVVSGCKINNNLQLKYEEIIPCETGVSSSILYCYDYNIENWVELYNTETGDLSESLLVIDGEIIPNTLVNSGESLIYSSVNGYVYLPINGSYNILVESEGYLSRLIYHDFSNNNNLTSTLGESAITINITEKYSNNPINNWILYNGSDMLINTTNSYATIYPNHGEYNNLLLHSNINSFSDRNLAGFNVTNKEIKQIDYELLPTELNITAKDFLLNSSINNFTVSITSLNSSHSESYSTTTGELIFGVINNDYYNITIDAAGYSLFNNNNVLYINGNTQHIFKLFTENSILFNIYNENTGEIIKDKIDIIMDSPYKTYSFNITNGSYYIDNVIDGIYSIKAYYNSTVKYYSITVGGRSHSDLSIYFGGDYSNVTFSFLSGDSGKALEDVYFTMSRYINNSLVVVGSGISNILGDIKLPYVPGIYYKLISSKKGYATKEFILDPINENKYYVRMYGESSNSLISDGVSVYYHNNMFIFGENNFSISFNSPQGTLTNYNYILDYPTNSKHNHGNNANGEVFDFTFNITDVSLGEFVKLTYSYNTTIGEPVTNTILLPIEFISDDPSVWTGSNISLKSEGLWAKIILITIIIIFVSGFAYLIGGSTAALAIGMLSYALFIYMGIIPLWSVLISFLLGFLLIIKLGGD